MKEEDYEIVISRFNENLEWTKEEPFCRFSYTVYNKGPNNNFCKERVRHIISLPNVGRNDHTILYHIVDRYQNGTLSPVTVFLPGSADMVHRQGRFKKEKAKELLNRLPLAYFLAKDCTPEGGVARLFSNFTLSKWKATHASNTELNDESFLTPSKRRPFGKWYQHHFGNQFTGYYQFHGMFSVDHRDILQHPVSRYQNILQELVVSSNPEVGHYTERAWLTIFGPLQHTHILPLSNPSFL
jgi:hypothetical protein